MEEKKRVMKTVDDSRTEQVHLIMHQHLNAGGRLFGGMLMQWVDEVSGVVAMRHCGTYRVTTAAVDNLQFKEPVYEGEILVMIGYVTYVSNTSMEVEIDSYVERSDGMRYMVNRAFSVMVAVNEKERPTPIPGTSHPHRGRERPPRGSTSSQGNAQRKKRRRILMIKFRERNHGRRNSASGSFLFSWFSKSCFFLHKYRQFFPQANIPKSGKKSYNENKDWG